MERAYSLVTLKAIDRERRTITGTLTTPEPDRGGDIFEPLGATFRNPLPLLLEHDRSLPVGTATIDPPTAAGITFTATIPIIEEAGALKTRIDTAWQEITAGLRIGVSHGFTTLPEHVKKLPHGALHFLKSDIFEVSLVVLPQHRSATIATVKSLATTGGHVMTLSEQITALEHERTTPATRLATLAAGGLETAELRTEFDGLEVTIKSLDDRLTRLRSAEALQGSRAQPVIVRGSAPAPAPRIEIVAPEKGTAFVRWCKALAAARGNHHEAYRFAIEAPWSSTPEVANYYKAAITPATTTDAAWAGALVPSFQRMASEFMALVMPATIIGQLKGLFEVPFNVSIPIELAGGTAYWVGQGKPKPLTNFNYGSQTLGQYKVATIVTLTEELARNSSPKAEEVFRRRLQNVIREFLDQQFIDPTVSEMAGIRPASITNGLTGVAGTPDAGADLAALLGKFIGAKIPLSEVTVILSEANAFALSMQHDNFGNALYPDMSATGGKVLGVKTIVSATAGELVVGVAPGYILYADEGGTRIDMSTEASLQMSDAPMDPTDATTVWRSMFQNNEIALRAERVIAWKRATDAAVNYLTATAWPTEPPVVAGP